MATTTPSAKASAVRPASQPLRVPPADTVWTKYSAHNEAPLSAVGSLALHGIVLGLLLFYVLVLMAWFRGQPKELPIETIRMPAGGGGNPKGSGNAPGVGNPGEEVADPGGNDPAGNDQPLVQRPPLDVNEAATVKHEFDDDLTARRFVDSGNENMKMLSRLDKEVRDKLRAGINPGAGKGGAGKDGGKGAGEGSGNGSSTGGGNRALNEREKRNLRWSLSFGVVTGQEHLQQLTYFRAIIALPSGRPGAYKICDLSKHVRPPYPFLDGDLSELNRMHWEEDSPTSLRQLMDALGVRGMPPHVFVFMPIDLEKEMLQKELAYGGLAEEQIYETKFKCIRHRDGKYEVVVTAQTTK